MNELIRKEQIVKEAAENLTFSQANVREILNAVIDTIYTHIAEGDSVDLAGLGRFEVLDRAPRVGRNPQTKEVLVIPARKGLKFRPTKTLKENVKALEVG